MAGSAVSLVVLQDGPELFGLFVGTVLSGEGAALGNDLLGSVWALDKLETRRSPPLLYFFDLNITML